MILGIVHVECCFGGKAVEAPALLLLKVIIFGIYGQDSEYGDICDAVRTYKPYYGNQC